MDETNWRYKKLKSLYLYKEDEWELDLQQIEVNYGLNIRQVKKLERKYNHSILTPRALTRKEFASDFSLSCTVLGSNYNSGLFALCTNLPLNIVSPPHPPPASLLAFWRQQRQQWNLPFVLRIQIPRLLLQQLVQPMEKKGTVPSLQWSHERAPRNQSPSEVRTVVWVLCVLRTQTRQQVTWEPAPAWGSVFKRELGEHRELGTLIPGIWLMIEKHFAHFFFYTEQVV